MTNLVLLRHGQSYSNSGKHVHQDTQNLLTQKGIMDTIRHAKTFRNVFPDMHFDHVYVSPMHRAKQTAYNFLSIVDNDAVDIELVEDFRERDFGFRNFLRMADLIEQHGQDVVDSWDTDLTIVPAPGGDSMVDVYNRVVPAFKEHVEPRLLKGEKVLVVSHYYVMKALMAYIQYDDVTKSPVFEPQNCVPVPLIYMPK